MFGAAIIQNVIFQKLVGALLVITVIFSAGWTIQGWRKDQEIAKIQTQHAKERADAEVAMRKREQDLSASAAQARKVKDEEIANVRAKLDSALVQLRDRKQRPSGSSVSQTTAAGSPVQDADGTKLYREDAEFLIREAARADELRAALQQCQTAYQELRK
jgi:hypothetical protein